ncbi:AAA family ATPase [Candidatus Pacearchaeota archaeon]|nr:AAA family ATPase [Candidatus Pacearchaeota archaeon]
MRIIKLQAQNYKRLKAVEITPDGNTVVISGKNGQGKTSTLDAIWAALAGGDAGKKNKRPIRKGEDRAVIKLDLGDLVITRKWTGDDKTYLTVENQEGAAYKSPQAILDALVGRLTFDPLEFAGLRDKEQVVALLDCIELDIDLAKLDEDRADFYTARANVNREVKRLEGALSSMDKPKDSAPVEEVSASAILQEIEEARTAERTKADQQECNERTTFAIQSLTESIGFAEQELKDMKETLKGHSKSLEEGEARLKTLVVPDIPSMQVKLDKVEETNALVRADREYIKTNMALGKEIEAATSYTKSIATLDKKKANAIKTAKMPVEGLSFDEDGLTFNGVPFSQASSAEQLKVSVAMAMAVNPKLRVIRITDGSLLDSDSMKIIEAMAADHDYQVWIEVVDATGKVGIYIEDGEIV